MREVWDERCYIREPLSILGMDGKSRRGCGNQMSEGTCGVPAPGILTSDPWLFHLGPDTGTLLTRHLCDPCIQSIPKPCLPYSLRISRPISLSVSTGTALDQASIPPSPSAGPLQLPNGSSRITISSSESWSPTRKRE